LSSDAALKEVVAHPILGILPRVWGFFSTLPFRMRSDCVQPPARVAHSRWIDHLEAEFNKEGFRILEIGSRNVTGANFRQRFSKAKYVGFDFYPGENVDIVGDAHKLSTYFDAGERFDLIFSSAVFEHLCMPWIAAEEIAKMLRVGGALFVETHFSYMSHNRPWHFFQFSDMALRALFNPALGFELIESGMSNPIAGYYSHRADGYLRYQPVPELYCHSEVLCRKIAEPRDFDWKTVDVDLIVGGTTYPPPHD
jgi:hypothetical protein